jgi:hypothetical protein
MIRGDGDGRLLVVRRGCRASSSALAFTAPYYRQIRPGNGGNQGVSLVGTRPVFPVGTWWGRRFRLPPVSADIDGRRQMSLTSKSVLFRHCGERPGRGLLETVRLTLGQERAELVLDSRRQTYRGGVPRFRGRGHRGKKKR